MPWYKSGTVSVTQNSNAVIGTGTEFISNSRVGDAFIGPDGTLYEVTNIASNSALAITPAYKGASSATGFYALAPMQGYNKATADALRAASLQVGDALGGLDESVAEAAASAATATAAKDVVLISTATAVEAATAAGASESHVAVLASAVEEDAASSSSAAAAALASKNAAAISEANAAASAGSIVNPLPMAGGTMSGAINEAPVNTIASAATVDIGAATSNVVFINGVTTIASLGIIPSGARRTVRFLGALVLTHNATSLILPYGVNITTAANDTAEFLSLGGGNWFCLRYTPANGKPLAFAFDRSNIVGTVTDSAGIPSGAIIESGSNANGSYVKFADGTLMCRRATPTGSVDIIGAGGTLFISGALPRYNWAVPFVGNIPECSASANSNSGADWCTRGAAATLTQTPLTYIMGPNSATRTISVEYIAFGRWKA
jgi:hypothetical protein